jgi:hypothetical protein
MYTSITPDQVAEQKQEWPKDTYCVRYINGQYGQQWAVCDEETWGIITLSYTEVEARAILALFEKNGK